MANCLEVDERLLPELSSIGEHDRPYLMIRAFHLEDVRVAPLARRRGFAASSANSHQDRSPRQKNLTAHDLYVEPARLVKLARKVEIVNASGGEIGDEKRGSESNTRARLVDEQHTITQKRQGA